MKAAIIQARVGSERFPKKVLKKINGKAMVEHVINRVRMSKKIDKIVLAIPDNFEDDVLLAIAEKLNVTCVRGSEQDVLSRYLEAAKRVKADVIVRITADCPLIDSGIIDDMLKKFEKKECDYFLDDVGYGGYSRGFDVDIFSLEVLEKASRLADKDYQREGVTDFILENPKIFRIKHHKAPERFRRPDYRLCVDEKPDLVLVKKIFEHFKPRENFTAKEIIEYLDKNSKLVDINKNVKQKL